MYSYISHSFENSLFVKPYHQIKRVHVQGWQAQDFTLGHIKEQFSWECSGQRAWNTEATCMSRVIRGRP